MSEETRCSRCGHPDYDGKMLRDRIPYRFVCVHCLTEEEI